METLPEKWLQPLAFRDGRSLPNRLIPGPMDGVTEGSFVTVLDAAGLADSWFTPFIRISNGVPRRARLREKLAPYLATGKPVIAQIMGGHPEILAETARRLHEIGATCVDLNCACPSATVLASHSGGYCLTTPDWMAEALAKMKAACGTHAVSVKIRCGYYAPDEIPEIAAAIRQAAPDMVTCHFRTVRELYRPVAAPYSRLAEMHALLPGIPFIGSGDLFSVEDARQMALEADVDGVAPARGLMRNPALLRELAAACKGVPCDSLLSPSQRLALLNRIGEASGQSRRNQGFLLKIARVMFGEETDAFQKLLDEISRG